jgi:hypothetical protein
VSLNDDINKIERRIKAATAGKLFMLYLNYTDLSIKKKSISATGQSVHQGRVGERQRPRPAMPAGQTEVFVPRS